MTEYNVTTIPQVKAALRKNAGVMVLAAKELGISRQALHRRVNADEDLQDFIAQIEDEMIDTAEAVIKGALVAKDRQVARWYLERKGRSRGYATRAELTGPNGSPIPVAAKLDVTISYVDSPDSQTEEEIPI